MREEPAPALVLIAYKDEPSFASRDGGGRVPAILRLAVIFGLTEYLARALGPTRYGLFALTLAAAGLLVYPLVVAIPEAVARLLAAHAPRGAVQNQTIEAGGLLGIGTALAAGLVLLAAAGVMNTVNALPEMTWPLRWAGLALVGQTVFALMIVVAAAVRGRRLARLLAFAHSALEVAVTVPLVVVGTGVAGASLARAAAATVAALVAARAMRRVRRRRRVRSDAEQDLRLAGIIRTAGAMLGIDLAWGLIVPVQVILIAVTSNLAAVGSFGAAVRFIAPFGYAGIAAGASIGPRLASVRGRQQSWRAFDRALRWLIIGCGALLAPLIVWAGPIAHALLGQRYPHAASILRVSSLWAFIGAPTGLIAMALAYVVEPPVRWAFLALPVLVSVVIGYVLIQAVGVVGGAIALDAGQLAYLSGLLWSDGSRLNCNRAAILPTALSTVAGAVAMAAVMYAVGRSEVLSPVQWITGAAGGLAAFAAVLLASGSTSLAELTRRGTARLPG